MTDSPNLALAEEIERRLGNQPEDWYWSIPLYPKQYRAIIAALRAQPSGDWVMVSERLPDDSRPVLIHACEGDSDWDAVACFKRTNWRGTKVYRYTKEMVDRWMPLPQPPALSAEKERG